MEKLIILGATGNCLDILDAARLLGFTVHGFLDDNQETHGSLIDDIEVLGSVSQAAYYAEKDPNLKFICGIGSYKSHTSKLDIILNSGLQADRFIPVIHPSAQISPSAEIGLGTVILSNVSIGAQAQIGSHVMVLQNSVIGHNSFIGNGSILAAGVIVSGNVTINQSCYLGAGSVLRDGVSVGENSLLGMGGVLTQNINEKETYVGLPARQFKGSPSK